MFNLILSAALIAVSLSKTSFALSNTTSNNLNLLYIEVNSNLKKKFNTIIAKWSRHNHNIFLECFPNAKFRSGWKLIHWLFCWINTCTSLEKDIVPIYRFRCYSWPHHWRVGKPALMGLVTSIAKTSLLLYGIHCWKYCWL